MIGVAIICSDGKPLVMMVTHLDSHGRRQAKLEVARLSLIRKEQLHLARNFANISVTISLPLAS